ncbi:MAG: hypothetical protein GDA50_07410 [Alphaproteobacteria bacterium GM202ARS2]|nr:hypothetical protein [Alphaproteobacteria bacterium GM202ARS2]
MTEAPYWWVKATAYRHVNDPSLARVCKAVLAAPIYHLDFKPDAMTALGFQATSRFIPFGMEPGQAGGCPEAWQDLKLPSTPMVITMGTCDEALLCLQKWQRDAAWHPACDGPVLKADGTPSEPDLAIEFHHAPITSTMIDFYLLRRDDPAMSEIYLPAFSLERCEDGYASLFGFHNVLDLVQNDDVDGARWQAVMIHHLAALDLVHETGASEALLPIEGRHATLRRARWDREGWSYNVVTIGPKRRRGPHQGGTHASPRCHRRRGHYRTLGDRRVWIKQTTVGDDERGGVLSDYQVQRPALPR